MTERPASMVLAGRSAKALDGRPGLPLPLSAVAGEGIGRGRLPVHADRQGGTLIT